MASSTIAAALTVIAPGSVYEVESSSQPGTSYRVTNGAGGWSCRCQGFRYRRDCRHVQAVRAAERVAGPVETPRLAEARAAALAMLMGR